MAWHTILEAQKLTGKSRRTLYRDMSKGRLSWASEGDNARRLETSELMRAYGALLPMTQPDSEKTAHSDTGIGTQDTALILAELKGLREEVAELRKAMQLIEHKPDHVPNDTQKTAESVPGSKQSSWWRSLFTSEGD